MIDPRPLFRRHKRFAGWGLAACLGCSGTVSRIAQGDVPDQSVATVGDETTLPADKPEIATTPPLKRPFTDKTLGGRQFWADVELFRDWRIQQNVLTKHYRLLDGADYRYCSGTREECCRKLAEIREQQKLPPMSGEAVILIHGIVRSPKSMVRMQRSLAGDQTGWQILTFGYPSTRVDLETSADYLDSVIRSLAGVEKIHFVTHSMGGLLVRTWLARHGDPRIGRLVMIATPNLGADLADRFHNLPLYRFMFGPAGQQLTRDPAGFAATLPTPEIEFGVIAGGRGDERGYNPLIPGDDDGTVGVVTTRLPGASDFVVVDRLHTMLVAAPEVHEYALRFLKTGQFRTKGARQPVPLKTAQQVED